MNEVFISYSHLDNERAQRIARKLKARKIKYFLAAKGIQGGDPFKDKIRDALVGSQELWVIVSPGALKSEWVMTEWGAAWALKKHIVPILHQCSPGDLPERLRDHQAVDFADVDKAIQELLTRQTSIVSAATPARQLRSSTFLFDIDGTVLDATDNLENGIGSKFLGAISQFAALGYRFVFITGNDYEVQKKRVLDPVLERGLGSQVFCFSDGGSRAFEFDKKSQTFTEIKSYASANTMTPKQVKTIDRVFGSALKDYLARPHNDVLKRPHIQWINRTLDYIDIGIYPLRPSFRRSADFTAFCDEIAPLLRHYTIRTASLKLIPSQDHAVIIRASGKTPDSDADTVHDLISRHLMFKPAYSELSKPELEKRGGHVVCQIALKPFNDEKKREDFRRIIAERLDEAVRHGFSVLLGGRTTIDIQRKGVNKRKAIEFLVHEREFRPTSAIYFGNEFMQFGNDRSVAEMEDAERPAMIVNVGNRLEEDDRLRGRIIDAGNGPQGTVNHLEFLLHQLK